jgi:fucose permease
MTTDAVSRRWVLGLCCYAIVAMSFVFAVPAVLMPRIAADLSLDYARQGVLFSATVCAVLVPLVSASIADRIGSARVLLAGSLIQAAGCFWIASAHSFGEALAGGVVLGAGGAATDPLTTPLVCAVYPERRARMSNVLHGFFCIGLAATAAVLLALLEMGVGWRSAFRAIGALCLPHGVAALLRPLPKQTHQGAVRLRARDMVRDRRFLVLAAAMTFAGATEVGPTNWLPTLVQRAWPGAGATTAGAAGMIVFGLLMAAGRFLTSTLCHRFGVERLLAASAVLCTAGLTAIAAPLPPIATGAALAVVGFGVGCLWPTVLALAGDRFPDAGASMFSVLSMAGGIGCIVAPAWIGWVASGTGRIELGLASLAAAPLLFLLLLHALRHNGPAAR